MKPDCHHGQAHAADTAHRYTSVPEPNGIDRLYREWRGLQAARVPDRRISDSEIERMIEAEARLVGSLAVAPARTLGEVTKKLGALGDILESDDPDLRLVRLLVVAVRADVDLIAWHARDR